MAQTLDTLEPGTDAFVVGSSAIGATALRLLEMGFVPGVRVGVIKRAPLGDPLELSLRGYRISLRIAEARAIEVETVG